jgi:hypothetical protein
LALRDLLALMALMVRKVHAARRDRKAFPGQMDQKA